MKASNEFNLLSQVEHLFDRIYRSKYNPLYQSGSVSVALFVILVVTGIYLLLFYRVGNPWQSVVWLQEQWYLGRWIRAVHRYATDLLIVTASYHALKMILQGRAWGPRILAWLTGVCLLGLVLFSTWTGYVMVWDDHGLLLAKSGSRFFSVLGFLKSFLNEAFDGSHAVTATFFFINLFAHVGLPLTLFFFIWIHTSRLARAKWFPESRLFWGLSIFFTMTGIIKPALLGAEGNLFQHDGITLIDWISGWWIPLSSSLDPVLFLSLGGLITLTLLLLPWWWPKRHGKTTAPAQVDTARCGGCRQCEKDCPFEAVVIQDHPGGKGRFSTVDPDLCTSCGLCAGSCTEYVIGPPGRTAIEQIANIQPPLPQASLDSKPAILYCSQNPGVRAILLKKSHISFQEVECIGTIHPEIIKLLLLQHPSVTLWGCPARNCENREGFYLAHARSFERRLPSAPLHLDKERVKVFEGSVVEANGFFSSLDRDSTEKNGGKTPPQLPKVAQGIIAAVFTLLLFLGVARLNGGHQGRTADTSALRLSLRLPLPVVEIKSAWTPEELAKIPPHMRLPEKVVRKRIPGKVLLQVDGSNYLENFSGIGKKEGFSFVSEEFIFTPGHHFVKLSILLGEEDQKNLVAVNHWEFAESLFFTQGEAWVASFDGNRINVNQSPPHPPTKK